MTPWPGREGWARRFDLPTVGPAIPLVDVVLAESLLFADATLSGGFVAYALALHLVALAFCALAPLADETATGEYFVLALLPLLRLVEFGTPAVFGAPVLQLGLVYLAVLPAALLVARLPGIPAVAVRPWTAVKFAAPLALGCLTVAIVEWAVLDPALVVPRVTTTWLLVAILVMGVVGVTEELVFRGLLQETLAVRVGETPAILVAGSLFGVMHAQYGAVLELGFAAAVGVAFGVVYARTESLAVVASLHGGANVVLFALLPATG